MPVCATCRTTFHACSNCYHNKNWEYEYCSTRCWRESNEYKLCRVKFKTLYSTINEGQRVMLLHLLNMSHDYLEEIEQWKEVEKKKEIRKHNMEYLGLNDQQYTMHEFYMQEVMKDWPKDLINYITVEHGSELACGDALSCLVSEWIKNLPSRIR